MLDSIPVRDPLEMRRLLRRLGITGSYVELRVRRR